MKRLTHYYLLDRVSETIVYSFFSANDAMTDKIVNQWFDTNKIKDKSDFSLYLGSDVQAVFVCETFDEVQKNCELSCEYEDEVKN